MDFSLVIPCFNEEQNIDKLIEEIQQSLLSYKYEIIIVDDMSTDNSIQKLEQYTYLSYLKIIKNSRNRGQSFSIYEGIKNSISSTIITIDCDGQNNPKDIPK